MKTLERLLVAVTLSLLLCKAALLPPHGNSATVHFRMDASANRSDDEHPLHDPMSADEIKSTFVRRGFSDEGVSNPDSEESHPQNAPSSFPLLSTSTQSHYQQTYHPFQHPQHFDMHQPHYGTPLASAGYQQPNMQNYGYGHNINLHQQPITQNIKYEHWDSSQQDRHGEPHYSSDQDPYLVTSDAPPSSVAGHHQSYGGSLYNMGAMTLNEDEQPEQDDANSRPYMTASHVGRSPRVKRRPRVAILTHKDGKRPVSPGQSVRHLENYHEDWTHDHVKDPNIQPDYQHMILQEQGADQQYDEAPVDPQIRRFGLPREMWGKGIGSWKTATEIARKDKRKLGPLNLLPEPIQLDWEIRRYIGLRTHREREARKSRGDTAKPSRRERSKAKKTNFDEGVMSKEEVAEYKLLQTAYGRYRSSNNPAKKFWILDPSTVKKVTGRVVMAAARSISEKLDTAQRRAVLLQMYEKMGVPVPDMAKINNQVYHMTSFWPTTQKGDAGKVVATQDPSSIFDPSRHEVGESSAQQPHSLSNLDLLTREALKIEDQQSPTQSENSSEYYLGEA